MWLAELFYTSINFIAWLYVSRLWKFIILLCSEHSHHFSDKVGTIRNELFKLRISIICKFWRTFQKLYIHFLSHPTIAFIQHSILPYRIVPYSTSIHMGISTSMLYVPSITLDNYSTGLANLRERAKITGQTELEKNGGARAHKVPASTAQGNRRTYMYLLTLAGPIQY